MSFFKEFRDFAMKGNVIDLAVGIIIGAAFNAIVNSLVESIIMPVIGLLTNGANFTDRFVLLNHSKGDNFPSLAAAKAAGAPVFAYGAFIQSCFQFLIIAFSVFLLVKLLNAFHRKKAQEPAAPPAPTTEEQLLMEIRDAIKAK